MLFGKFGKSKIQTSISLYKDYKLFPNNVSLYFPERYVGNSDGTKLLNDIFLLSNKHFGPFYSLCDFMSVIKKKKKLTGFSVDLQAELIGMFWLTYLNKSYVDYFGKDRFELLPCKYIDGLDGVFVNLGKSPLNVDISREKIEYLLGKESFVDPLLNFDKPVGRNALMFNQMVEQ